MIGKHLAQFRILDKIGEGGMGEVYRAEDENLGRKVALKVLPPDFAGDEDRRNRFVREARMAAAVNHPNIATIHGIDEVDGRLFISMELVEGRPLSRIIDGRPLPVERALDIAVQVASGLARAHQNGIVHRDLKPDNILVDDHGHAKVLDFGLAKPYESRESKTDSDALPTLSAELTQDGRILGTVAYMSPEQARGLSLDFRSDMFSFGVLLYEMVTGKKPFEGPTVTDTLTAILRDTQPPIAEFNPDVPAELERILSRCLEKEPENRYGDTVALSEDLVRLKRATDSQSVSLPRVTTSGPVTATRAPSRWWTLAAVAAVAVVVGLAFGVPEILRGAGGSAQVVTLENSLAVLPFENLQDPRDASRFGQILQELIITDLSDTAGFRVFSSQRLFDIQKQLGRDERTTIDRDMATEVARQAGASTMLTGTLSRLGENWILTTQLVLVANGTVIKSERIDGPDLYTMVDELTPLVRNDLGLTQLASFEGEDVGVRERTTESLEAYQAYLEGVEKLNALRFADAAASLQSAVEIDPSFGRAQYKLAMARWWKQDLSSPLDESESGPAHVLKNLLSGELKLSQKDRLLAEASLTLVERGFPEAVPLYERVTQLYPDEKEAWYGLGEALFHSPGGYADEAAKNAFEEAIRLDPAFRLAYFHVLDYYVRTREIDKGLKLVRVLLDQDPGNPMWHTEMAVLTAERGGNADVDAVVGECLNGVPERDGRILLLGKVATVFSKRGQLVETERLLENALEEMGEEPDAKTLAEMGWTLLRMDRFEDAEPYLDRALEASGGKNPMAHRGRIRVALARGHDDEAWKRLRQMSETAQEGYATGIASLETMVQTGRANEAEAALEKVLAEAEGDAMRAEIVASAVGLFMGAGEYERAERLARVGMELVDPGKDAHTLLRLGWARLAQKRYEESEGLFRQVVAQMPFSSDAVWALAVARLVQGNAGDAERILRTHVETSPESLSTATLMAYVLADQGRWTEAETYARRAMEWAPNRRSMSTLAWILVAGGSDVDGGMVLADRALEIPDGYVDASSTLPFIAPPEHALGLAHLRRGNFERAVTLLEESIRANPSRKLAREHLDEAQQRG